MVDPADIESALQLIPDEAVRRVFANLFELLLTRIALQDELIQSLRDEVNRLKGEHGKPKFNARKNREPHPKSQDVSSETERGKGRERQKRSKLDRVVIDRNPPPLEVDPAILPPDAVFKGYEKVVVQDIKVVSDNALFRKAKWYSPSTRKTYLADLPSGFTGQFGPNIKALSLALTYNCNVTEKNLLDFWHGAGVEISAGTLSAILTKGHEAFCEEYDAIYHAGLSSSKWQHTDHTSTTVNGQMQNCQVVGNPLYTIFATTEKKDRLTILNVLRNRTYKNIPTTFRMNEWVHDYMEQFKLLSQTVRKGLRRLPQDCDIAMDEFYALLKEHLPRLSEELFIKVRDAAAIASYHAEADWPIVEMLLCDDAPQFKLVTRERSLCWVHEGRRYKKLFPSLPVNRKTLKSFLDRFWQYYHELLAYCEKPRPYKAKVLRVRFDRLFSTVTGYDLLDEAIARTLDRKTDLLMALSHPEIPLHNNDSELAVRIRVRKRDCSYGPRTLAGVHAWDTMMSILATCRKLRVSYQTYLLDRISGAYAMPSLASLIPERAKALKLDASWGVA
jgi:hypothetical protein